MASNLRKDFSQKGGHRWRIGPLDPASYDQSGAVRAKAEVVAQKLTIRPTNSVAAVSAATLTTILTFTAVVPTLIRYLRLSGELPCRVDFLYNTVVQEVGILTSNRKVEFEFPVDPFPLDIGDIIDLKVYHNFTGETSRYDATLYGLPE